MDPKDLFELSFYEDVKPITNKNNVHLVSHVETGILYVKKTYTNYKLEVFSRINKLNIPGIPKCKLMIEDSETGTLTIVEEYINGINLANYLNLKERPLFSEEAAVIFDKICAILQQLHNQVPPIIHRDIKPSNILITPDQNIYIVDFNISRVLTADDMDTTILGTQGYAAPEQYGFMQCTEQTDIYSLGVLLKFLLTKSPTLPQKYEGPLASAIHKATVMDPNSRYKTVADFNLAIQRLVNEHSAKTASDSQPNTVNATSSTNRHHGQTKKTGQIGQNDQPKQSEKNKQEDKNKQSEKAKRARHTGRSNKTGQSNTTKQHPTFPPYNPMAPRIRSRSFWANIKIAYQKPFEMSLKAKILFPIAVIITYFLYIDVAIKEGTNSAEVVVYLLCYILFTMFVPFGAYYVYKKNVKLVEYKIFNIILHAVLLICLDFTIIVAILAIMLFLI